MNSEDVLGAVGLASMTTRPGDTCVAMGISDLPILAPSHLLSVMESASVAALTDLLEPGETTYIEDFEVKVLNSVGIGVEIRATARCSEVEGNALTFLAEVYEGESLVARATIKRTAVERVTFLARTAAQSLLKEVN